MREPVVSGRVLVTWFYVTGALRGMLHERSQSLSNPKGQ